MGIFRAMLCSFICASCITTSAAKPRICSLPLKSLCSSQTIAETCKVAEVCSQKEHSQMHVAPPVNITLYYESQDLVSQHFIDSQLAGALYHISEIMNLELVPYGTTTEIKQGSIWNFTCKHGLQECEENIIETCAIITVNNTQNVFPFIHCMEMNDDSPVEIAQDCAKLYPVVPIDEVLSCANSTKGNQLQHQMALKTAAVTPPLKSVPLITLNGTYTRAIQAAAMKDLLQLICSTYTGPKPSGCNENATFRRNRALY